MREALSVLAGLVLDDGSRWGERAASFQWAAAEAVLEGSTPFVWDSRPRGGSKTTDAAGVAIAAMTAQLQPGSRLYALAGDRDQARLLVDAIGGFAARTPALRGVLSIASYQVKAENGCVLEVLAADEASAYGLKPSLVIADEVCQWPASRNAKGLWHAVVSAMGKVPGARLLAITTSGDPSHWSQREIFGPACESPRWRILETPGPLPWVDSVALEEQRRMLPESVFRRLHLNEWAASEDRLVMPGDLAACVTLDGPQAPAKGRSYVAGLDVGLTNDRTAVVVAHLESRDGQPLVVVDRLTAWEGSKSAPVQLADVEAWLVETARLYRPFRLIFDPYQAQGLAQRLRAQAVTAEQFTFSSGSVGRLGSTLHLILRNHQVALPDDPELLDELVKVRLRETSPGVIRMDHDAADHDDKATALALAAYTLLERYRGGVGRLPNVRQINAGRLVTAMESDRRTARLAGLVPNPQALAIPGGLPERII